MDKLRFTLLVAMGIFASGSGIIQVSAADFIFEEDFSSKEVANYDEYTPTFNSDTSNLTLFVDIYFFGSYRMDVCSPGGAATGVNWELLYRANGTGDYSSIAVSFPSLPCSNLGFNTYEATVSVELPSSILDLIVNDDASFLELSPRMTLRNNFIATVISFENWYVDITLNYDFDTTYLFNYFLSDQQYIRLAQAGFTLNSTQAVYLEYVMTTAGNDRYFIYNSNISSIGTTRKRYAIDYQDEYFRGESVGARFSIERYGATDFATLPLGTSRSIRWELYYNFLNVANKEQDIQNVPEFEFEYEDCGSFLALNVPCFINNGLAYVVNDAPVISDAFTLLNAGMKLGGQAFSIIGQFSDNNLFGVLVLGGLGITAVRWFLKQD